MSILRVLAGYTAVLAILGFCSYGQEPLPSVKPTEHVLGTVSAVDSAAQTITVRDDKTAIEYSVLLTNTRTLLKVTPGAKDLKSATRITADELAAGDRVDVRGFKSEGGPNAIAAKSVVLMSARDLQQKHQSDATAWQDSTVGTVTAINTVTAAINIDVKTPEGVKSVAVQAPINTEFTRYSPENPKIPARSEIGEIRPGDQLRVIGQKNEERSSITAAKIYSGAFRTVAGTITAISPDGKLITLRNLQTKQPAEIIVTSESSIRRLPPEVAARLARRLSPAGNPNSKGTEGAGTPPPNGIQAHSDGNGPEPGSGMRAARGGDLSQLLQRVPPITVSDLKNGDAMVVSGAAAKNKSQIIATSIIVGVEPIFQSAPPRQGQSLRSDWSLDMGVPAQ